MKNNRLYRSRHNRMIGGVCGGLAEYLGVDAGLVRLIAVLVTLLGGSGVLAYVILWILVPDEPAKAEKKHLVDAKEDDKCCADSGNSTQIVVAVVLIVLGTMLLLDRIFTWLNIFRIWPLGLIILGIWLIARQMERD